uniref:Uncharacterized protein n=1 Tax=Anguilla anguilla TaxID=7936 RepID=A0A0E9XDJ9_ANGAN
MVIRSLCSTVPVNTLVDRYALHSLLIRYLFCNRSVTQEDLDENMYCL